MKAHTVCALSKPLVSNHTLSPPPAHHPNSQVVRGAEYETNRERVEYRRAEVGGSAVQADPGLKESKQAPHPVFFLQSLILKKKMIKVLSV